MSASSRIGIRYAKALYKSCSGAEELSEAQESLNVLSYLFNLEESGRILHSPVMPLDLKRSILQYGLGKVNSQGPGFKKTQSLVHILGDAGRISCIPDIYLAFVRLVDTGRGILRAQATSYQELPQDEEKALIQWLQTYTGKSVQLEKSTDADLLGGLVISTEQFVVDLSLKSKIEKFAQRAMK